MTSHVRRASSMRAVRNQENSENAPTVKSHQSTSNKALAVKTTAGGLRQGAKRAVLSDVSNRAPLTALDANKPATSNPKRTLLSRPVRREILQPAIPTIPEHQVSDGAETTVENGDMDVDILDIASPISSSDPHFIAPGANVTEPRYTRADKLELQRVSDEFVDEWDEWGDISMIKEYADDIFTYLHELETKLTPNANYIEHQAELEWKMRSILIEWLVQVHARFHLLPETLFLTINYIDRFLSLKTVSLQKLQLVGATALFLAAKYEEIQCPSVAEIIFMVDNGYTADEVLKAERFMVGMLDFELGWPGPMSFLRRISKADEYDIDIRTIAKYMLETMLMSHLFIACPPSFSAAIADYAARAILKDRDEIWTDAHVYYSTYTEAQIKPAVDILLVECLENARENHNAIFSKYSEKKHKRVSTYVESWLNNRQGFAA